ncbi:MAG TPA: efflux RND transporter periplasmic adaptor subunit [Candidatus Polarisedimenticolia bacterium]|nr:efflux RND transporter periplasmic adaptor subunit [Candidatus Polarisedimenticolia bacterium]
MKYRLPRMFGVSASMLLGGLSIWLSNGFTRGTPETTPPVPGIHLDGNGVAIAPGAPQWQMLKLGLVGPSDGRWTDPVPARVVIDETRASKVQVPLSGRVTSVFVELGEKVREGTPLFSVASTEIADLRAEEEKAGLDLEVARTGLDRVRGLVAARALPAKEELAAQQQFRQAEVALRLATAKLESLRVSSERADNEFTVTAPRPGVVVEKNVLVGQSVAPETSSSLMVVADLSSVWVVADLFESEAGVVREGAAAQVTSPSIPDLSAQGKVDMVSAVVDPNRHTVPIRVRLPNPDGSLRPNVYARVRFAVPRRAGAVEVPASALITDGTHQYVYVQDARGRFSRREILAGSSQDGHVPVLSGLASGETIVEEGGLLLDNQVSLGV